MSVKDAATAISRLFDNLGLPKFNADFIRLSKLDSFSARKTSKQLLLNFILFLKSHTEDTSAYGSVSDDSFLFIDHFLRARRCPLLLSQSAVDNAALNLVIIVWLLIDSRIYFLPEFITPFATSTPMPLLNHPIQYPSLKQYLSRLCSIKAELNLKEKEIFLVSNALMRIPKRMNLCNLYVPFRNLDRTLTLKEIMHIFRNLNGDHDAALKNQKHLIDMLTLCNRNSSAFLRWLRISLNCTPLEYDHNEHDGHKNSLQQCYSILHHMEPRLSAYYRDHQVNRPSFSVCKDEESQLRKFHETLDWVTRCLNAPMYEVHPMSSASIQIEHSSSRASRLLNSETEKKTLASIRSCLRIQTELKKERLHSVLIDAFQEIVPSVACLHKPLSAESF